MGEGRGEEVEKGGKDDNYLNEIIITEIIIWQCQSLLWDKMEGFG